MDKIYSVAVSCRGANGWVEYDTEAKTVQVFLDDEKATEAAMKFLTEKHDINIPRETLRDFTTETIDPLESVEKFQIVLTRLWENTQVHVDWSRPVEYVKQHPRLD